MVNQIIKVPRAPMSKPESGLGIDSRSPYSRGLLFSYPVNEGDGTLLKNYAFPQGYYDLAWEPTNPSPAVWGTFATVPGLHFPLQVGNPPTQAYGNTGGTNPSTTGANLLPLVDFSQGITMHVWMRPTESLVGVVTSYAFCFLGEDAVGRGVLLMGLTRGPDGMGGDCWKPVVNIYRNGTNATQLGGSFGPVTPWDAPFDGSRVHIDSLPFEHVVSITPNGDVSWYASDGYSQSMGTYANVITPPDNTQYWPQIGVDDGLGLNRFEGDFWALNIWNYPMGPESAFALMRNPLQMYLSRPGGGYGADVIPPDINLPVVTLTANPDSISAGYPSTLSWTSQFADTLVIDNGIGSVIVPNGSTIVFPTVTTTYEITATNDFGTATAQATVTVTPRGQGRPPGVSAGAILQRDLTKSSDAALGPTDDGVAYPAFVTIGSVVLTHPSELAMVLFLTTEALAIGSHPDVSVLLDEIEESIAVPFTSLGAFVPDTPVLVASQTLFSDRFYISQTQLPAVCRHMQVKITWPTEIAANELLTWSVIGANVEER